ncbi:MAG: hypothetical protein JW874_00775 [Spirochaetales bacterium]|nr:hypothetical protein [Spirochaetales bacterium]
MKHKTLWIVIACIILVFFVGSCITVPHHHRSKAHPPKAQPHAKYWIDSDTNIRHNASCRFYGHTKHGYFTNKRIGKRCKYCGG